MADHVCSIVPPYILEAMAESQDPVARQVATETLAVSRHLQDHRREVFAARSTPGNPHQGGPSAASAQGIVADYLFEQISKAENVDEEVRKSAAENLALSQQLRDKRQVALGVEAPAPVADTTVSFWRGVYTVRNQGELSAESIEPFLPGDPARLEGQPRTQDPAVNQAYDNCLEVLKFYKTVFNYDSVDNAHLPVKSSVHCGRNLGNAFWHPTLLQMLYGDGNAQLYNFTACLDVIGHEMTHGVTQFLTHLQYARESGALNEHLSDVFGVMVKQKVEQKTAKAAEWLIGEGCLMPGVTGVALRSMKQPGTAYSNLNGKKDPQPDNYNTIPSWIKNLQVGEPTSKNDYGGVHYISGIPNKAFVTCALAFDGYSWEKAGRIWWAAVTSGLISPNCTFIQFADITVDKAAALYGATDARTVRDAWNAVGVVRQV